jgi:hypothetical protein
LRLITSVLALPRRPQLVAQAAATLESWSGRRLGFPSGYVADVLQTLEVLTELGHGGDARLSRAITWLLTKQDGQGRWKNEYAYQGKTWAEIERQGQPSKWVTLRACRLLDRLVRP